MADLAAKLDFPGNYAPLIAGCGGGGGGVSCILWADDLVLLSGDEGLNNMLSKLSTNIERKKVSFSTKREDLSEEILILMNDELRLREYKYLGFL